MRFNIFYQIHKGLRAMLYETGLELQATDFNNEEEAETISEKLLQLVEFFDLHGETEDALVFPFVSKYEPSVIDLFEEQHITDHKLAAKIKILLSVYQSTTSDAERIMLASAIRKAYVDFMVFNLQHMAEEEETVNNLLWRYYSDEDLKILSSEISASQTPENASMAAKWMMRGLSNEEIVSWMKTVEKNAPETAFNQLFAIAEKELSEKRFRKVLEGLTEGVMLS